MDYSNGESIKDNGKTIIRLAMEHLFGRMVISIRAIGRMT
jgi:hypothetical protein